MTEADLAKLGRDELIALVLEQAAAIAALQARIDELTRSGKRQASPFSRGTLEQDPKRPGREPGQGMFKTREAPAPEQLSEPPIDVPVEQPARRGEPAFEHVEEASTTDLPKVVQSRVRVVRVDVHRRQGRGATARGRHPEPIADRRGAAAHRLGPRPRAAAHHAHDRLGDSVRDAAFRHTDDTGRREGAGRPGQCAALLFSPAIGCLSSVSVVPSGSGAMEQVQELLAAGVLVHQASDRELHGTRLPRVAVGPPGRQETGRAGGREGPTAVLGARAARHSVFRPRGES